MLFIAREAKCGAKRQKKLNCWACQHQFLVNNNHLKARCTEELLLLRLKSLLLLCVLAGWLLQEREGSKQANEQQRREALRKIPRCVSYLTSISSRTMLKQSTTSAKRNMTSCLDRMTSEAKYESLMLIAICEKLFLPPLRRSRRRRGGRRRRPSYAHGGLVMRPESGRDAP